MLSTLKTNEIRIGFPKEGTEFSFDKIAIYDSYKITSVIILFWRESIFSQKK